MERPVLPKLEDVFEHVVAGRDPEGELVAVLFCEAIQVAQQQHNIGEEDMANHCAALLQQLSEFLALPGAADNASFIKQVETKLTRLGGALPTGEELTTSVELRLRDWLTLNELLKHTHDLLCDNTKDATAMSAHKHNRNMINAFHMCCKGLHWAQIAVDPNKQQGLTSRQTELLQDQLGSHDLQCNHGTDLWYSAYESFLNKAQLHNWRKTSYDDQHTNDTIHIYSQKELRRNGQVVLDSRYYEPHDAFGFANTANVCSTLESHVEAFFKPSGETLSLFKKKLNRGGEQHLIKSLRTNTSVPRLPELVPHRNMWCFEDGILCTHFPLDPQAHKMAEKLTSAQSRPFYKDFINGLGNYRHMCYFFDPRLQTGCTYRLASMTSRSSRLHERDDVAVWQVSDHNLQALARTSIDLTLQVDGREIQVQRAVALPWQPCRFHAEQLLERVKTTIYAEIAIQSAAVSERDFYFQLYTEPPPCSFVTSQGAIVSNSVENLEHACRTHPCGSVKLRRGKKSQYRRLSRLIAGELLALSAHWQQLRSHDVRKQLHVEAIKLACPKKKLLARGVDCTALAVCWDIANIDKTIDGGQKAITDEELRVWKNAGQSNQQLFEHFDCVTGAALRHQLNGDHPTKRRRTVLRDELCLCDIVSYQQYLHMLVQEKEQTPVNNMVPGQLCFSAPGMPYAALLLPNGQCKRVAVPEERLVRVPIMEHMRGDPLCQPSPAWGLPTIAVADRVGESNRASLQLADGRELQLITTLTHATSASFELKELCTEREIGIIGNEKAVRTHVERRLLHEMNQLLHGDCARYGATQLASVNPLSDCAALQNVQQVDVVSVQGEKAVVINPYPFTRRGPWANGAEVTVDASTITIVGTAWPKRQVLAEPRLFHGRLALQLRSASIPSHFLSYSTSEQRIGLLETYLGFLEPLTKQGATLSASAPPFGAYLYNDNGGCNRDWKEHQIASFRDKHFHYFQHCLDTSATQRFLPHNNKPKQELCKELACIAYFPTECRRPRKFSARSINSSGRLESYWRRCAFQQGQYNYNVVGCLPRSLSLGDDGWMVSEGEPDEWFIVSNPSDQVLAYQLEEAEEDGETSLRAVNALLGRLLHWCGNDEYSLALLLLGKGATGKSVIEHIMRTCLPDEAVGTLSSNMERTFGLGAVMHPMRHLCICPELGGDGPMQLDQMKSIISHETTNAPIKNGKPVVRRPLFQMLMLGNGLPSTWQQNKDAGGAISRRFATFPFNRSVRQSDDSLKDKARDNIGAFLVKVSRSYAKLRWQTGAAPPTAHANFVAADGTSMDGGVLGKHFASGMRMLMADCNPHTSFLEQLLAELQDTSKRAKEHRVRGSLIMRFASPVVISSYHQHAQCLVGCVSPDVLNSEPYCLLERLCAAASQRPPIINGFGRESESTLRCLLQFQWPLLQVLEVCTCADPAEHVKRLKVLVKRVAETSGEDAERLVRTVFAKHKVFMEQMVRALNDERHSVVRTLTSARALPLFKSMQSDFGRCINERYATLKDIEERHEFDIKRADATQKKVKWSMSDAAVDSLLKDNLASRFFVRSVDTARRYEFSALTLVQLIEAG